MGSY
jgi:hypothetical protein